LGGAASLSGKMDKYKEYFKVINGKIFNFYSKKDIVLTLLESYNNKEAIGKHELNFPSGDPCNEWDIELKTKIRNFETNIGHISYRNSLSAILLTYLGKEYFH